MKQLFNLVVKSANVKTGAMPNSMSHAGTCPDACPLKEKGCYAKCGPIGYIFSCLSTGYMERKGKRYPFGLSWAQFLKAVKALPVGQILRINTAGDFQGKNNKIDEKAMRELVEVVKDKRAFSYTHYPVEGNREILRYANANGFTVNLSANSLSEVDGLKAENCGPVCCLLPEDFKGNSATTPKGNRVVVCPAMTKGLTCEQCQLCQKQRSVTVGFLAHGSAKKRVSEIAAQ